MKTDKIVVRVEDTRETESETFDLDWDHVKSTPGVYATPISGPNGPFTVTLPPAESSAAVLYVNGYGAHQVEARDRESASRCRYKRILGKRVFFEVES